MTIQASLFGLGFLLMTIPADRLLSSLVRLRSFDCFQTLENSPRYRPWWWVPLLWLDPLRGFFGALALKTSLRLPVEEWVAIPKGAYGLFLGILGVGILCQMFTRRDPEAVLAPVGFVVGIVAALAPWTVTAIAITMGVTGMYAFRRFHAFFSAGFVVVAFLGFVLSTGATWLAPALVALGLPCVVSAMSGRALEIPTRSGVGPSAATE